MPHLDTKTWDAKSMDGKTWYAKAWDPKAGGRDRAGKQRVIERHNLRSTIGASFERKARFRSPGWVPQTAEVAVRQRGLRKARPTLQLYFATPHALSYSTSPPPSCA